MWRCERKSVVFLFFIIILTPNNRDFNGATWNYRTVARWVWVRVEMCHAFQLPRCKNVAMARSLVACCSRFLLWKDLRRNLDCHLCQVRDMWTKYFYYFQGLRGLKCYRTKSSNRVNYRSKWPLQKTFSSSTPPPAWISRVFDTPPPPPARISRILESQSEN